MLSDRAADDARVIGEPIDLPDVGLRDGDYTARVRIDASVAGIQRDDYIVIRPQHTAQAGEVVVVMLDDGATIRAHDPDAGGKVLGRVVGFYRGLERS